MLTQLMKRFHHEDKASSGLDYAVMIGAGVLFIVFAFYSLSSSVSESFEQAGKKVEQALDGKRLQSEEEKATYKSERGNRRPGR